LKKETETGDEDRETEKTEDRRQEIGGQKTEGRNRRQRQNQEDRGMGRQGDRRILFILHFNC